MTGKLEPLSGYLTDEALNDVSDPALDDFIEKVFFDTAVYNPDSPNLQFPDTSAVDLEAITGEGFEVYGLPLQANALVATYRTDLFENADEMAAFETATGASWHSPTPGTSSSTSPRSSPGRMTISTARP